MRSVMLTHAQNERELQLDIATWYARIGGRGPEVILAHRDLVLMLATAKADADGNVRYEGRIVLSLIQLWDLEAETLGEPVAETYAGGDHE